MIRRFLGALGVLAVLSGMAMADELTGAQKILCAAVQATVCDSGGDCENGPPWLWSIPQFVEVDFGKGIIRTTDASKQNRSTPFKHVQRSDGFIFLQGVEGGRAFSFVIEEESGSLSAAVARSEITVSVFGACTPTK